MTVSHSTMINDDLVRDVDDDGNIPEDLITTYTRDGVVRVRGMLRPDEVGEFLAAERDFHQRHKADSLDKAGTFTQLVNVWRQDDRLAQLTLHPRIATVAEQLAGMPLRIWHDHMLVKEPHNNKPTFFHQDRPYWPHTNDRHSLSCWIALVDVPPERGCMSFLPGTQHLTGLRPQNLAEEEDLFGLAPELRWLPRITYPLRAGDVTFHTSYTGHMALDNRTDEARYAHITVYMDAETRFNGNPHVVTNPLGLAPNDRLDGETFPEV
ncbi:phytanoyl-CoA dioxygenase family protein [Microlunatus sp. Gsoil 973]|uniref:phytanoyl-CoA dioxygenase family protein n=1 Tax=Microlunatus sp. Gsoil 973 TaxID=2672569 RepID=UPI001E5FDE42|nr:phytanoyl-CoA dioxygenase family protein [Microlunatus sp. Gsoil 973]